ARAALQVEAAAGQEPVQLGELPVPRAASRRGHRLVHPIAASTPRQRGSQAESRILPEAAGTAEAQARFDRASQATESAESAESATAAATTAASDGSERRDQQGPGEPNA